ncbi:MAG: RHS repeat-associated core domain-containing protein [Fimbriimonadaceae bacterium]
MLLSEKVLLAYCRPQWSQTSIAPALAVELTPVKKAYHSSTPIKVKKPIGTKGVRTTKVGILSDPAKDIRPMKLPSSNPTLLDEVGQLRQPISAKTRAAWLDELKDKGLRQSRRDQVKLWLAEVTMRVDMEPQLALDQVNQLLKGMNKTSPIYGPAVYDRAMMMFYCGRYNESVKAFAAILKEKPRGVDEKQVAAFYTQANACAGYHNQRAAAGITEPTHIDPLCGASGLAIALKYLKKPHGKEMVSKLTPHTGFGSNMQDLVDGAKALGLSGYCVGGPKEGLKAIFKVNGGIPIIAHVEHDHYIAVTGVTDKGVTYWCSDCGSWPGGERKLTWKQWDLMEADAYLAIAEPGSDYDKALAMIPKAAAKSQTLNLHTGSPVFAQRDLGQVQRMFQVLMGGGLLAQYPIEFICGQNPQGLQCSDCTECPTIAGLHTADPVNLANLVEEYTAPTGLDVYNPIGPSVSWRPSYNSLARTTGNGFGAGWHHPYLTTIFLKRFPGGEEEAGSASAEIIEPNSAVIGVGFNTGDIPTSGVSNSGVVQSGYPYIVKWKYDTNYGEVVEITSQSRTKYTFVPKVTSNNPNFRQFYLARTTDRMGSYITLEWTPMTFPTFNLRTNKFDGVGLSAIRDSGNQDLLTITHNSGNITSANDRYGRSVYYTVADFPGSGLNYGRHELTTVTQIVPTGTPSPPNEYEYGYTFSSNGFNPEQVPYLHTISTINPQGTGMSTATINYVGSPFVYSTVDANGVTRRFLSTIGVNTTTVETLDSASNVVGRFSVDYHSNMAWTEYRNAAGEVIVRRNFGGASPFRPTMVDVKPPTLSPSGITSNYTWDQYSNLLTSTNPKGVLTTYTRNYGNFALGELTEVQETGKTSTKLFYNQPSGTVSEIQAPIPGQVNTGNRQSTTITYDTLGNVTGVTAPGNNASSTKTVTLAYGSSPKIGQPVTVTSPGAKVTSYTYTARGQVATITDPNTLTSSNTYNIVGQTETVSLPPTGSTGSGNTQTQNIYQYPGGPLVQTNAKDESGVTVRSVDFAYGKEGELLSKTGSCEPVYMTYDEKYNTKTLKDGNNNITNYVYNLDDLPTEIRYPGYTSGSADKVIFGGYDAIGRVNTRTDGRGQVTNYQYQDELVTPGTPTLGLLEQVNYVADSTQNITMSYDNIGQVLSTTDGTGVASATYDDLGGLKTATRTYTGIAAKTATYTYYPDGSRSQMATVAGNWDYLYDIDGRPTSMTSPAGTSSIAFDNGGRIINRTLPNGTTTDYQYTAVGMLTSLVNNGPSGTHNSTFNGFTFDGVFNQLTMASSISTPSNWSGNRTWTYDAKDQLTSEISTQYTSWNHGNTFDTAGNPTTFKNNTRTYNANNQITSPGTNTYDGNGNPTTYNGTSVVYDVENRVSSYGTVQTNGYRSDGLRAWKQTSAGRTYFLYDGGNPIIEMDSSGNTTNLNVFAPDGLIARKEGSTWTYYTFDAQGNVVHKLNSSNQPTAARLLDAWGQGVETTLPRNIDPWGYNAKWGYYYDRETSLYYCQNRMYDASTGRWLNRDPIGTSGGINLYGYCGNGANGNADPSGLSKRDTGVAENGVAGVVQGIGEGITYGLAAGLGFLVLGSILTLSAPAVAVLAVAGAIMTGYAAYTAITGRDPISGEELTDRERARAGTEALIGLVSFCKLGVGWLKGRGAAGSESPGDRVARLTAEAQADYPKLAGKTQRHHPWPQYLGGPKKQGLVELDAAYHQKITNAWYKEYPKKTGPISKTQAQEAADRVYAQYPLPTGTYKVP